ncbi:MAG: endolytic transglycosylase MltG [Candidatus Krumholzibacteriia bacterium]
MRRLGAGLAVVVAAGLGLVAWAWLAWTGAGGAAGGPPVLVTIPPGMPLVAAADTLAARGLLEHRRLFLLGARLAGRDRALQAGLYELAPGLSARRLLEDLTSGRTVRVRVTVPEGLDADQTALLVAGVFGFPAEAFLAAADSLVAAAAAPLGLPAGYADLLADESAQRPRTFRLGEGYLAPDTYVFAAGSGPAAVADHLVATQRRRLVAAAAVARDSALTPHALLTLASIVEAEARRDDERGRIAAVYANRLAAGRRLEADPTVAHVLGKKGERLFYRDLAVDSPWNTYRRRGLPPGPIGSPGEASLQAAARPDPDCDALFFVSDGADGHVFSRTAQEHEQAVRRFRQLRAAERRRQDSGADD